MSTVHRSLEKVFMVGMAGLATLTSVGCAPKGDGAQVKPPDLFSEHKFLTNCAPTKQFGESCYGCGDQECAFVGAVCLHVKPEPDDPSAWLCSRQCVAETDCPATGWHCIVISTDASEEAASFYCVPSAQ